MYKRQGRDRLGRLRVERQHGGDHEEQRGGHTEDDDRAGLGDGEQDPGEAADHEADAHDGDHRRAQRVDEAVVELGVDRVVAVAVAFVWTLRTWAERATGDDRANLELYQQLVEPLRLPVLALALVAVMVIGFSRVLLTLPSKTSSVVVFGAFGVVVLAGAIAIAIKPRISKTATVLVLFVLGLLIIAGGIIGAINGPREFERHQVPGQEAPAGEGN